MGKLLDCCLEEDCWGKTFEPLVVGFVRDYVWGLCLGTLFGDFVWEFCLGTVVGGFVWETLFGNFVWDFVWEFLFGDFGWGFVWEFCLGTLFGTLSGNFVWGLCLGTLFGNLFGNLLGALFGILLGALFGEGLFGVVVAYLGPYVGAFRPLVSSVCLRRCGVPARWPRPVQWAFVGGVVARGAHCRLEPPAPVTAPNPAGLPPWPPAPGTGLSAIVRPTLCPSRGDHRSSRESCTGRS